MTDWTALLVDPGSPMRLLYDVGESESPHDRFGRCTLRVWSNGDLRLDHRRMGALRSWGGTLPADRVARLRRGLAEADFPKPVALRPGPGVRRRLYVRAGADAAQVELPMHDLPPAWAAAIADLDGLLTALGGPELGPTAPAVDVPAGTPLRHLDATLGRRWFADPGLRATTLRSLMSGQSPPQRLDLRGLPAAAMDLPGVDLTDADLTGADLMSADLQGARLTRAHLVEADLCWAHLGKADLQGADLRGASLADADLGGADLRNADLGGAELREANLAGARLDGARLTGTILENR